MYGTAQFTRALTDVNADHRLVRVSERMTVISFPAPQALWPDDLRVVGNAFDEALHSFPAEAHELVPYTARQLMARYIMDRALSGVVDTGRLRDGALDFVRLVATKQMGPEGGPSSETAGDGQPVKPPSA